MRKIGRERRWLRKIDRGEAIEKDSTGRERDRLRKKDRERDQGRLVERKRLRKIDREKPIEKD